MKIYLASDLHLEIDNISITNKDNADVLVLAGDILVAEDLHEHPQPDVPYDDLSKLGKRQRKAHEYREFIKKISSEFPNILVIAGNHEFYNGKWHRTIDTLYEEYGKYPNVHFLEDDKIIIDDVLFIGSTLWTDLNKGDPVTLASISGVMNDYHLIRNDSHGYCKLRPAHTLSRHRKSLEYFKTTLKQHHATTTVVVSHHAPCSLSIHENYKGMYIDNGAYYSDLSELILDNPQIKLWCHGHMHNDNNYVVGNTNIVSNPRGYVGYERGTQDIDPYYPLLLEI